MGTRAYEPKTGRSKFTRERKAKLLEAFALGASVETAAALARISGETLYRWLRRGQDSAERDPESEWGAWFLDVQEARATPRLRALQVVNEAMEDYPLLAWKFLERTEKGYAPPAAILPGGAAPTVIQLSFANGAPLPSTSIEPGQPMALPDPNDDDEYPASGTATPASG